MMDFWSNHFSKSDPNKESPVHSPTSSSDVVTKQQQPRFIVRPCQPAIPFQDRHPFLTRELLQPKSRKAQAMLADFRARGATIRRTVVGETTAQGMVTKEEDKLQTSAISDKDKIDNVQGKDEEFIRLYLGSQLKSATNDEPVVAEAKVKFPVLYSNYSAQTKSESNFCVYPSSIVMELSGSNCLTLGSFLDNYCFRSDYKCPNNECKSQITDHIRRFCYSNGSVCLTIRPMEIESKSRNNSGSPDPVNQESSNPNEQTEQEPITVIMSSTYCDICNFCSKLVPLPEESISMSFAKFLMLRICGQEYIKTNPSTGELSASNCNHKSFLRNSQYFIHKNMIATFEYSPINVRSIYLPQIFIRVKLVLKDLKDEVCEELKKVSVRGWEAHGSVHDKVTNLRDEMGTDTSDPKTAHLVVMIIDYIKDEEKDRSTFRRSVEQIQVDLCSKNQDMESMYQVMNSIFFLKQQIANFIASWNIKMNELHDKRRRSTKTSHGSASLSRPDSSRQIPSLIQSSVITESATRTEVDGFDVSEEFNKSGSSDNEVFRDNLEAFGTDHRNTLVPQELEIDKLSLTPSERSGEEVSVGINPMMGDDGLTASIDTTDSQLDESDLIVYKTLTEADKHMLDEMESKRQAVAKKSKGPSKTSLSRIIEQFRPGISIQEFENPFAANERYNLPVNDELPILVRDDDAGSMIAFTLASTNYKNQLNILGHSGLTRSASQISSATQDGQSGVESSYDSQVSFSAAGATFVKNGASDGSDESIECQFEDESFKFSCTVYFAERLRKLRSSIIKLDIADTNSPSSTGQGHTSLSIEEMFVRSLSTALEWKASGGKSGSRFRKTLDDRFIIKEMNSPEVASFKLNGKRYCEYIDEAVRDGRPTALAKILGIFKVQYKSMVTGTSIKMYVLVIENIFYGRNIIQKFDLKGSSRNRTADIKKVSKSAGDELVLLDTNLVQLIRDSPLYVRPEEKRYLQGAIDNDSTFLNSLDLLDYSLLVGIDDQSVNGHGRGQLVVGVIDYLRPYTWDKKLESAVKSSISGKEQPTIIKPEHYKERFLNRMNQYFLPIPDSESKVDLLESSSTVIVL